MASLRVLVLLFPLAAALRPLSPPKGLAPSWACDVEGAEAAPLGALDSVPRFLVGAGNAVEREEAEALEKARVDARARKALRARRVAKGNATKRGDEDHDEDLEEFEAARQELMDLMVQVDAAKVRYFSAVEKMLKVPAVDGPALTAMMEKKDKDIFVVFYAPWCPHCQSFVLGNEKGIPHKAPLELFNKEMMKSHGDVLSVVRYDVAAHKATVPKDFQKLVQYIPAIFLATTDGKIAKFEGNPSDPAALKAFITAKGSKAKSL